MVRAHGSYPWCREFDSPPRYYPPLHFNRDESNLDTYLSFYGRCLHFAFLFGKVPLLGNAGDNGLRGIQS